MKDELNLIESQILRIFRHNKKNAEDSMDKKKVLSDSLKALEDNFEIVLKSLADKGFLLESGDKLILLSIPTHVGGLMISLWGVKKFGIPRRSWAAASLSLIILGHICRFTTPVEANVNLSQSVWKGYENYYSSHLTYVIFVYSCSIVTFFAVEILTGKFLLYHEKRKFVDRRVI